MEIFGRKPIKAIGVGEWDFEWYWDERHLDRSYLEVKSTNGQFCVRIAANAHVFGYLLAAAEQGIAEQLHGWITMVYAASVLTTQDQGFTDDIQRAITKWQKRMMKKGEKEAEYVTETQIQSDEAFMGDVIAESAMSKEELAKKRAEDREILSDILKDGDN